MAFVHPISLILQPHPTEVVCHPDLPVQWKIDDSWYCSSPEIEPCPSPLTLTPLSTNDQEFISPRKLLPVGLTASLRRFYVASDNMAHIKLPHSNLEDYSSQLISDIANQNVDRGSEGITILRPTDFLFLQKYLFTYESPFDQFMRTAWF